MTTPNISLPELAAAQAQPHLTVNSALRRLDGIVQLTVISMAENAPPGSPSEGDRYVIGASPTGAWSGRARDVAISIGGSWAILDPADGWLAFNQADGLFYYYDAGISAWSVLATGSGSGSGGTSGGTAPLSPDTHPSTPNALDDEFEGTSLDAKWAWRNQGSSSVAFLSGSLLLTAPANASFNVRGLEQSITGSFRVQCKVAANVNGNYHNSGLYVCNNSSGKIISVSNRVQTGNRTSVIRANSSTSAASVPYDTDLTSVIGGMSNWTYFEIEYDGTDLFFKCSGSGVSYFGLFSESAASFLGTPDRVGIFTSPENASFVNVPAFDWFRRVA